MELSTWLAFFAAAWAISLSPGPGALAAMSAGLNHGFRKGYFTTLGLVLGIWVQLVVVGVVVVPRPLPPVHRLLGQRIRIASPR